MSEIGYVEGQNVAIEYRWANNENDQLPELAADLVRRQVALIVAAGSTDSARAAKAATSTIPIVLVFGADPVRLGLVESLNRPGGNITGIGAMNFELGGKRLGLLHELLPRAGRFAILFDPNEGRDAFIKDVETSATTIGKQIEVLSASSSRDIDAAFAALIQKRADGLLVAPQTLFLTRRGQIVGNMPCPQSFLGARRSKSAG
ncbi:MAG: ABC transporter substrate-binding protein [Xanthobacteraceae bacterium]